MNKLPSPALVIALLAAMAVTACTGNVRTPDKLSEVKTGSAPEQTQVQIGQSAISAEAEEAVSEGCVQAWRKALKGDEGGAMAQLQALEKKYPKVITIKFMMGQVQEHAGKKREASEYYRQAVEKSSFNTMYLYKLSESLRLGGEPEKAIPQYRKLLESQPGFPPAELGLAKALWDVDHKSVEARERLRKVLAAEPENKEALQFKSDIEKSK